MKPLYGSIDEAQTQKEALARHAHLNRMLYHCEKECESLRALVVVRDQELYDSIEDTYKANKKVELLAEALSAASEGR